MNKRTAALIGVAVVLLLFAGVFCGAAAAVDDSCWVDDTKLMINQETKLHIHTELPPWDVTVNVSYPGYLSGDPSPGPFDMEGNLITTVKATGSDSGNPERIEVTILHPRLSISVIQIP